jgi:hypothetical protein
VAERTVEYNPSTFLGNAPWGTSIYYGLARICPTSALSELEDGTLHQRMMGGRLSLACT